ncbi:MAG: hypothetical protein WA419_02385 [Silvibacterium sp.]
MSYRPLAATGSRIAPARGKECHEVLHLAFREDVLERRHAVTSLEYLFLDLTGPTALANAAQIGCTVSANSRNAMATLATLGVKYTRAMIARIRIRRVCYGTTHHN